MLRISDTIYWIPDGYAPDERGLAAVEAESAAFEGGTIIRRAASEDQVVLEAASVLREGGLVAFPTETVYGLGASAMNMHALLSVYKAKGRPTDNPLIAHISEWDQLEMLCGQVPPLAEKLARRFWPGPLSILLPAVRGLPAALTAGLPTVAVRMPGNALARKLISAVGVPLAAPSANLSGRPSPTEATHVLHDLRGRIAGVIEGGLCRVGIESTVVEIADGGIVILRPGSIGLDELAAAGSAHVRHVAPWDPDSDRRPRSPGQKYRHYAPRAPLFLVSGDCEAVRREIGERVRAARAAGRRVAVLSSFAEFADQVELSFPLTASGQPAEVARQLYRALRECDRARVQVIFAQGLPPGEETAAVMNRLTRAADGNLIRV